jgi:hypothetical protein
MDERGGGQDRYGDRDRDRHGDGEKRPMREPFKPLAGREPELDIYIDKRFNFWNLHTNARVLLISNVPQVREELHLQLVQHLILSGHLPARLAVQPLLLPWRC